MHGTAKQAAHTSIAMTARYDRKTADTTSRIAGLRQEMRRKKNVVGISPSHT